MKYCIRGRTEQMKIERGRRKEERKGSLRKRKEHYGERPRSSKGGRREQDDGRKGQCMNL